VRPDSWWTKYDRNDQHDNSLDLIVPKLQDLIASL